MVVVYLMALEFGLDSMVLIIVLYFYLEMDRGLGSLSFRIEDLLRSCEEL